MRLIGLHLRLIDDPFEVVRKVIRLQLPVFQTFLTQQLTGRLVKFSAEEMEQFLQMVRTSGASPYLHVSYHANACAPMGIPVLRRELTLAKKLGFSRAVLHPGSGRWCGDKEQALAVLVSALNDMVREEEGIELLLENSAHGALSIGGDVRDFARVLEGLEQPEKIKFCIDTAHAYAFGYNIADEKEQDDFVALLDQTVGLASIGLIHLNDTNKPLGKNLDQHAVIGQGNIGRAALVRFANHAAFKKVPAILELPVLEEEEEKKIYESVRGDLL